MLELYSIASGSSGNCICVGTDQVHVLVDAGISGKKIEKGLAGMDLGAGDISAILITHEHIDHVQGLGVMARRHHLPIYATGATIAAIREIKSLGKIDEELFHPIVSEESFSLGDLTIESMPISHDAADPVAYRFQAGKRRMAVLTDLGYWTEDQVSRLQGLDALLLESNHDVRMLELGPYPYPLKQRILGDKGHLSNENCGKFLGRILHDGFGTVLLGHLSRENNMEELAYETVRSEITMNETPYTGDDFQILVAHRDRPSPLIRAV